MKKIVLTIGLVLAFAAQALAARQVVDDIAVPTDLGAYRTAVNVALDKLDDNDAELYGEIAALPSIECGTGINCTTVETTTTIAGKGTVAITVSKSGSYTIGTDAASEAYGGTIFVTGAATITAPAVASGMSFAVVTIGDVAVSLDVNASDKMILDGVTLADGDKSTNSSKAGDTILCQYYSADGWYCWSSTVLGGHWSDGN